VCLLGIVAVVTISTIGRPARPAGLPDTGALSLRDVVEARSIDSITVSPDQRRLAFRVLHPSLGDDRLLATWYAMPVGGGAAVALGNPVEPRMTPFFDSPIEEQPVWTADGQSILVLQAGSAGTQVHLLGPKGVDRDITHDQADIERFALSPDGERLDYWTRDARDRIAAAQDEEIRTGVHFDRTIATEGLPLTRNYLVGDRWTTLRREDDRSHGQAFAGDLRRKTMRLPADGRGATRSAAGGWTLFDWSDPHAIDTHLPLTGGSVGLARIDDAAGRMVPRYRLTFFGGATSSRPCASPLCVVDALDLRLMATDGAGRLYLLREDAGSARSKLYTVDPASGRVRQVFDAQGSLDGGAIAFGHSCVPAAADLICVHAGPTAPPRLVALDPRSARFRVLFDPNDEVRRRLYPRAEYLEWKDRFGRVMNGVLVHPLGDVGRAPLVITSYRCRGFLRGGVANVVSEFMLAERGFAVLCANSNPANNDLPPEVPDDPVLKMHKADIEGYRSIIQQLGERGLIDPSRVGMAGHSYSANIVAYAISHTDLFQAVVIGSGVTIDSASYWVTAPAADSWRRQDVLDLVHLPRPGADSLGVWPKTAPSLNARAIRAAVLMQPPETEYLLDTQLYAAIQDNGGRADMYVYPGASHMMMRYPRQQKARMQRSLDWFALWLEPQTCNPALLKRYPSWARLLPSADRRRSC